MGTWSIEPSDASIDQNGNARFPSNSSPSEKVYTIKYTDGDMVCEKRVIQEGTGCLFGYNANSSNIPGDRESAYIFGSITPNGTDVSEIIIDVYEGSEFINGSLSINSSNELVGTVKKNDTQEARIIKYRLKTSNGSVCYDETATQGKGCDCSSFSVTEKSVGKDAGTYEFATYTADPCITEITATENADWITAIGVNTNDKLITGTVLSNTGIHDRTATINVNGNGGNIQCPLTFQLVQSGTGCDCDAFWIRSELPSPWDWDDTTEKYVSIDYKICVSEISVSPTEHFNARRISTAMRIVFSPKGKNTTDEPFEDTLVVSYKVEGKEEKCFIEIPLRQEMNGCNCDEETVNLSWNWDESDVKTVTVSVEECVKGLSYNQVDDYIITNNGNVLSINPNGRNEGTQNRDGIIIVQYSTGSKPCSKHINVTQGTIGYTCSDIVISGSTYITNNVRITNKEIDEEIEIFCVTASTRGFFTDIVILESTPDITLRWGEIAKEGDNYKGIVVGKFHECDEGNKESYVSIKINGVSEPCEKINIFRVCPCAMDDCYHELGGDRNLNHANVIYSWVLYQNSTTAEYEGHVYDILPATNDSPMVPYSALTVDGYSEHIEPATIVELQDGCYIIVSGPTYTYNGVTIAYWEEMNLVMYFVPPNLTRSRKDYSVTFKVAENTMITGGDFKGYIACTSFVTNIYQAPYGGYYDRRDSQCDVDDKGQAMRKLRAFGGPAFPDTTDTRGEIPLDAPCLSPPFADGY